eukprot:g26384.t1
MGVRGLLSYVQRHGEAVAVQVDLAREALQSGRHGVTLLVDLLDFCAWFLPEVDHAAKGWTDNTLTVYGGEFPQHDDALCEAIFGLRHAGIYLEFFMDPPRGHGLVDSATNSWIDEGKRRCNQGLDVAKAVRLWCRGERNDLPNLVEARSLPPLFYEQVVATLARCGCKGKGGSFGRRNWPFKWWFESVLLELSLLIGTDATTPFIQKHKLYAQIGLRMGQDRMQGGRPMMPFACLLRCDAGFAVQVCDHYCIVLNS